MSRHEKIILLDRGALELAYPSDWVVKPEEGGHLSITDPSDSCKIEISYMPLAIPKAAAPDMAALLRQTLAAEKVTGLEIHDGDRGDLWFAWADKLYDCDDTERNERRKAHTRTFVASNGRFYGLLTFAYWEDDATWAVKAWERMVATLHLGDGVPLKDPHDHWSLKGKKPKKKK